MTVKFFDSVNSFLSDLPKNYNRQRSDDFTGYQSFDEARQNVWKGRKCVSERSAELLDKLEGDNLELPVPEWENSVVGFLPNVPAFLAGTPISMRRPVNVSCELSPIRIFASVCVSAGIGETELEKRGVALLALCRKLQAIRPVELYVYADMDGKSTDHTGACAIPVIKLETSPLDLTTTGYILSDPGFLRQLCFAWGDERGFDGHWAWNGQPRDYQDRLREVIGANPQDLVIRGGYLCDPMIDTPVEWVNDQVRKYADSISGEEQTEETHQEKHRQEETKNGTSSESSGDEFKPGSLVRIDGCRKGRTKDRSKYNGKIGEVQRKVVSYFRGKSSTKYRVKFQDGTNADFIPSTMRKV